MSAPLSGPQRRALRALADAEPDYGLTISRHTQGDQIGALPLGALVQRGLARRDDQTRTAHITAAGHVELAEGTILEYSSDDRCIGGNAHVDDTGGVGYCLRCSRPYPDGHPREPYQPEQRWTGQPDADEPDDPTGEL